MNLYLKELDYQFKTKPLLIGGKAKEYYGLRKAGKDTDLVVTTADYLGLCKVYPDKQVNLGGDLGVKVLTFEIWKTISLFNYDFLAEKSLEMEDFRIVSLEKSLFLAAIAMDKEKYFNDLKLIVKKIIEIKAAGGEI
jgi:hypothetical protein